MNELIFIGTVLIYLGSVLLLYKLFGKNGLFDFAIYVTFAFWGTYPVGVFMSILITTYVFKAVVAVLDTPFIYIARKINAIEDYQDEKLTKCLVNSGN